jgi:hypothetical protein
MRAINVLLSVLISLALGLLVLEGGLRLLGKGPVANMLQFDPHTGWSKKPGYHLTKRTPEFVAHFEINQLGLRDDPMASPAKPAGVYRVIALGDSFTLGFSVERDQHFVDLLEGYWRGEGRQVEVLNAGTEGWDTAQQVAWLEAHGAAYDPDLVLLFPYENDLYWNSQRAYQSSDGPREKPRYAPDGTLEPRTLEEPAPKPWHQSFAVTKWLGRPDVAGIMAHRFQPAGASRSLERELAPLLAPEPADMEAIRAHTTGALLGLKRVAAGLGAQVVVAPIPAAPKYVPTWHETYESTTAGRGLAGLDWSPDRPVELFRTLATGVGLPVIDVRPALDAAAAAAPDEPLYYKKDWHFNEHGNRVFAEFLHDELQGVATTLPAATQTGSLPPLHQDGQGVPFALKLYLGLLVVLTTVYYLTYRDEPLWQPPLKVAFMLGLVFAIFIGVARLRNVVPPAVGMYLIPAFLIGILGFVIYKLGGRITTITELLLAFIRRGHWYLMPLVVVLLSIGSLLVVAASSPFVAPFIYTLF